LRQGGEKKRANMKGGSKFWEKGTVNQVRMVVEGGLGGERKGGGKLKGMQNNKLKKKKSKCKSHNRQEKLWSGCYETTEKGGGQTGSQSIMGKQGRNPGGGSKNEKATRGKKK